IQGQAELDNKGFHFTGDVKANGQPAQVKLENIFSGPDARLEYTADVSGAVEKFYPFGFPQVPQLKGNVAMQVNILDRGKDERIKATIDASKATIDQSDLGWKKEPGKSATIVVSTHQAQ